VGWGSGEDEESGAILKVIQALGIFLFWQESRNCGVGSTGKYDVATLSLALSLIRRGDLRQA
jgi:hypothetical protein